MNLSEHTKDSERYIFGWLGYPNQQIDDRTCLLQETEQGIELAIPFKLPDDAIASWFAESDYPPVLGKSSPTHLPRQLWVKGVMSNETFCLVNPIIIRRSISTGTMRGYAILSPEYIVKGYGGIGYADVNKVRSYIPELASWTGLSTLTTTFEPKESSSVRSFQAGFGDEEPRSIATTPNGTSLMLVPADSSTVHHDMEPHVTIRGEVSFESSAKAKTPFSEQMAHHLDLSSLLSLTTWRNVGIKSLSVYVEDDVIYTPDDRTIGPFWRPVVSKRYEPWTEPEKHKGFLISYADIGEAGLAKWFELKSTHDDPLNEITYIARMHNSLTLQSQMLLYGTAFEELGGSIVEASSKKHRQVAQRIECILNDCSYPLFNDNEAVACAIANTYNAIKHPNFKRKEASRDELLSMSNLNKTTAACRALSLLWVGSKLGCSPKLVKSLRQESSVAEPIKEWIKEL